MAVVFGDETVSLVIDPIYFAPLRNLVVDYDYCYYYECHRDGIYARIFDFKCCFVIELADGNRTYVIKVKKHVSDEKILTGIGEIMKETPWPLEFLPSIKCNINNKKLRDKLASFIAMISILT